MSDTQKMNFIEWSVFEPNSHMAYVSLKILEVTKYKCSK